ncbi:MAG: cation:proton antiporter, partial [bacterium]
MTELPILRDLAVILSAALVVGVLAARLRLPAVVGLLIAGLGLGRGGLVAIDDAHAIEGIAEIGIALLLFTVGLRLPLKELHSLGAPVWRAGVLQVVI